MIRLLGLGRSVGLIGRARQLEPAHIAMLYRYQSTRSGGSTKQDKRVELHRLREQREHDEAHAELTNQPPTDPHKGLSMVDKMKLMMKEYWIGSKLLWLETKISSRLLVKVLRGHETTRREHRQLLRTTSDMFRMVPFIILLILPFGEFLLPVLLRFFPNMLPSTFEDNMQKESKKKNLLKARLEVAKFLQDAMAEMPAQADAKSPKSQRVRLIEHFRQIRQSGTPLTNEVVILFAKLFEDEFTLDNLSGEQLESLCKFLFISTMGTPAYLRFQLRTRFQQIHEDDGFIDGEGIASLSILELQQACSQRGIPTLGVQADVLKQELEQWIELSLKKKIPLSLLLMSKALSMSLEQTIKILPPDAVREVEHLIQDADGTPRTNRERLAELAEEERLILQENTARKADAQAAKERQAEMIERAREGSVDLAKARALEATNMGDYLAIDELRQQIDVVKHEVPQLTQAQLIELTEALEILSSKSSVDKERHGLEALKEGRKHFADNVKSMALEHSLKESRASSMLGKHVDSLIAKLERELQQVEEDIGGEKKLGIVYPSEDGSVSLADLEKALSAIKHRPTDPSKVAELIAALDTSKDGKVSIKQLTRWKELVAQLEGSPTKK